MYEIRVHLNPGDRPYENNVKFKYFAKAINEHDIWVICVFTGCSLKQC